MRLLAMMERKYGGGEPGSAKPSGKPVVSTPDEESEHAGERLSEAALLMQQEESIYSTYVRIW